MVLILIKFSDIKQFLGEWSYDTQVKTINIKKNCKCFNLLFSNSKVQGFFIGHILNYTEYNQQWNVSQVRSTQWTVQNM